MYLDRSIAAVVVIFAGLSVAVPGAGADLVISEFMAASRDALLDEDGDSSDWIEIQNVSAGPVDAAGWALTDDPSILHKWVFPPVVIESGGFLIVFASGKNRAGPELHTNFGLDAGGESLALVAPDGTVATAFPGFPRQREGFSFGVGSRVVAELVGRGSSARVHVPSDGALGLSWTGGGPFDDSAAAGWAPATAGIGYPSGGVVDAGVEPLGYWDFDDSAADRSGNGHGATVNGAVFSAITAPALDGGRSLRFDGVDDFVGVEIDVSETAFTSSMWIRADTGGRGIFTVVDGDLGAGGYDRLLYFEGGNIAARVWNNETVRSSGRNYADRLWHHVAHVVGREIGGQRIYVDGRLVASGVKAASDFDWQQRINIGFSNDAAGDFFAGLIDDVAVWDAALSAEQIGRLAAGASPLALDGVRPFVETDVASAMQGVSASVYVRIPFRATLPLDFDAIELRVRYDDGYIAYLNGVEVARRNAPEPAGFDARASSDRAVGRSTREEAIDLTSHVDLIRDGDNVLAFHGLNDTPGSEEFLLAPRLIAIERMSNRFMQPTPGAPNDTGVFDFVADTKFSVDRGFYTEPFDVEITTATEDAAIYFTTDGTEPSPQNPTARLHDGPIRIARTTRLRAAAFRDDYQPTNVDTHTYLFVRDVRSQPARPPGLPATWSGGFPADYQVDPDVVNSTRPGYSLEEALLSIPSVSVVTDPENLFDPSRGIYYHSSSRGPSFERGASIELIHPDGTEGFQIDAGLRVHGNSSRIHTFTPKHSFRIVFKSKFGPRKLRFPLFGIESFDQLVLRGASTDSWPVVNGNFVLGVQRWNPIHATYMRDQHMRDAQLDMGSPSANGMYVHLYLNGLYWGLYNLAERPTSSFAAERLGGEREEYDVLKDFAELREGTATAWNEMISLASRGLASEAAYQRIQGNDPDGTRNPALPRYLDVDNLIDYMILHITAGAEDWPDHNWWASRRRGPESDGFKFFVWDQAISNDSLVRTHTRIQTRFEQPISSPSPSFLYGRLMANQSFRRKFIDRVHAHLFNDGALTRDASSARWQDRQREIDIAIVGESARWGDSKKSPPFRREVEWLAEMNWMRDTYWEDLHPIAVQRFRNVGLYPDVEAPVFVVDGRPRHGGRIERGERLSMVVPEFRSFIDRPFIDRDNPASALVPRDGSLGVEWTGPGYVEGSRGETWRRGANGVGYENSSGYEDAIAIDVGAEMSGAEGNTTVYVRLPFTIEDRGQLDSFETLTLKVAYDDGFVAYLNGERVAAANAPASPDWSAGATAGGEANPDAPTEFDISEAAGLLRVGDNLLAVHGLNFSEFSSDMLILVELVGRTLDTRLPPGLVSYTLDGADPMDDGALSYTGPFALEGTTLVRARAFDGEEWSALTSAVFVDPTSHPLRVTEVMYHPLLPEPARRDPNDFEFIELQNVGDRALDLRGLALRGGIDFDFAGSEVTTLGPLELVLVVRDAAAFGLLHDTTGMRIAGEYDGKLDNAGDSIVIEGPLGETILEFTYDDAWYPITDGGGHSLVFTDPTLDPEAWRDEANWRPSRDPGGSPGVDESGGVVRGWQRPGDANGDGRLDVSDAVTLLLGLFAGVDLEPRCDPDAGAAADVNTAILDVNGDALVDISDAIHLLRFLFAGGPAHALGPDCVRLEGCPTSCRG